MEKDIKENMYRVVTIIFTLVFMISLAGCKSENKKVNTDKKHDNPFELKGSTNATIDYSFGFGVDSPDPDKRILTYNGKDVEVSYSFNNGPNECNLGLRIYVNGLIQPYRINKETKEETMKEFPLKGNENKKFIISFIPVTGEKGDNLSVFFVTMLNPQIVKYSSDFKFFGNNQKINQLLPWKMTFLKDTEKRSSNISTEFKTNAMSDDFKKKFIQHPGTDKERNALDNKLFLELMNGNTVIDTDKLDINENEKKEITVRAYGGNTGRYRISVYLDHKLIPIEGNYDYADVDIAKDCISSITFTLDEQKYKESNDLYAVAVPVAGNTSMAEVVKSDSIVLKHK